MLIQGRPETGLVTNYPCLSIHKTDMSLSVDCTNSSVLISMTGTLQPIDR